MPTIRHSDGSVDFLNGDGKLVGRWAGRRVPDDEIYGYAAKWWGDGWRAVVATAIVLAESGGYEAALGDYLLADDKWGPSEGLWQIRTRRDEAGKYCDALTNSAEAYLRWKRSGWRAWGAANSGAYLKFMPRARRARITWRTP